MAKRLTATAAARRFSELLDQVEHFGEEFVIERHGRAVAKVSAPYPARRLTRADLIALLERLPRADPDFAKDMRRIRREQPRLPKDPWARYSTRRS